MKTIQITTALVTASLLVFLPVFAQTPTEEASSSSQTDFDTIKENVKKRLQEVVQEKNVVDITKMKVAYIGTLKSRAANTFSIDTGNSVKLASISSNIRVFRIPTAKSFTIEDVALDDYVVALGYKDEDDVLDTKRILVHKSLPLPSPYLLVSGNIKEYSPKEYILTLESTSDATSSTFIVSRKAVIRQAYANDTYVDLPRNKALPVGAFALVVYMKGEAEGDDNIAYHILLRNDPPGTPLPVTPTPRKAP